jgi:hypothetical protein
MRCNAAPLSVIISLIIITSIAILSASVLAANNPGHDSLYVLKIGDNVTGNINISGNLTATLVEAKGWFFGPNIVVRGDGSTSTAVNRIVGDTTDLTIDSTGFVYLKKTTGGQVVIGAAGTPATLNVTGNIYQQNKLVCLADGTNCPGSLGGANISGSGTTNYLAKWTSNGVISNSILYDTGAGIGINTITPTARFEVNGTGNFSGITAQLFVNGSQVCTAANGLCGSAYSSGAAGWTNTTTQTTTLLNVGVGTAAPVAKFQVNGSANFTNGNVSIQSTYSMCFNANCTARMYYNGTALIIEGQ